MKDFGKLARPWLRGFAGRQSPVDTTPVLASRDFPFPQQFTDNRETIRGEVVGILKLPADIALFQEVPSDQSRIAKGILRTHPGLLIPRDAEKCRLRAAPGICVWREGGIFVFDDTCKHEAGNKTPDERVIRIFDVDRPMRFRGRRLNNLFIGLLKLTALYQKPKRKMKSFEDRFEAAAPRANANLEKPSDPES